MLSMKRVLFLGLLSGFFVGAFSASDGEMWKTFSDNPSYKQVDFPRFNSRIYNRFAVVGPEYVVIYKGWNRWLKASLSGLEKAVWSADSSKVLFFGGRMVSIFDVEKERCLDIDDICEDDRKIVKAKFSRNMSKVRFLDDAGNAFIRSVDDFSALG